MDSGSAQNPKNLCDSQWSPNSFRLPIKLVKESINCRPKLWRNCFAKCRVGAAETDTHIVCKFGFLELPSLFFRADRRIFKVGNCCVVPEFGEAHQWAKAHFLVWSRPKARTNPARY